MDMVSRNSTPPEIVHIEYDTPDDSASAELENEILSSGRWTEIIGDDETHIAIHQAFEDSPQYKAASPQGQWAHLTHLSAHRIRRNGGEPVYNEQRSD